MKEKKFEFAYKVYDSFEELPQEQKELLASAKEATKTAYTPYSKFNVGAAARLENGEIIKGSNQENASFPVTICAERALLSAVSTLFPNIPVTSIAVTYQCTNTKSDHPISPCGLCRQTIMEYEQRFKRPIQLILGGMEGQVFVLETINHLLPLAFTSDELAV